MHLTTHGPRRTAFIPRRQSLALPQEQENMLGACSSMDQLQLFAPKRAEPPLALLFPVLYHAVGECLAHPHLPCKCVKTRPMAQSSRDAWHELGSRFKQTEGFARTIADPLQRAMISLRNSVVHRACSPPGPERSGHPTPPRVSGMSAPTAAGTSTPTGRAHPARRSSCLKARDRNATPNLPALTRRLRMRELEARAGGKALPKP